MRRREFLRAASGAALAAGTGGAIRPAAGESVKPKADTAAMQRELSQHRLAKIGVRRFQDRYPRTVGANAKGRVVGRGGGYQGRILTTDKGVTGWAMGGGKDEEAKRFVGTRVSDLFDVDKGSADEVPWWLDKALHDLAGQILNKPVYELLGGAGPKAVATYSGAIYFDDLLPADPGAPGRGVAGVLASCKQDYDAGYRAFKLKIGRGFKRMKRAEGLRRDIEVTRAVAEFFPDSRVLVDANDAYTVDDAIEYVRAVADCNLYWIEEPFQENRDALKKLRAAMAKAGCKAMIADGEARKDRAKTPGPYGGYTKAFAERLFSLAAEKLVDVCLFDLGIVGFTRWRRLMPVLVKAGLKASPHTWMWTPRPFYAAQLAAGVGNVCIVEGIPGRAKGIDYSAYRMKDGKLIMPDAPGFGLRLSR